MAGKGLLTINRIILIITSVFNLLMWKVHCTSHCVSCYFRNDNALEWAHWYKLCSWNYCPSCCYRTFISTSWPELRIQQHLHFSASYRMPHYKHMAIQRIPTPDAVCCFFYMRTFSEDIHSWTVPNRTVTKPYHQNIKNSTNVKAFVFAATL